MKAWFGRIAPIRVVVVAICLVTVCLYGVCAYFGTAVWGNDDPQEAVYNRMIDGFAQGRLSLARDVPAGFAQLADPYDPAQNSRFRFPPYFLYDLSYYKGKLYAYFGPAPALLLFGPYHLVTGRYLSYKAAAVIFCGLGFLAIVWVLLDARRRYSPDTPDWVLAMLLPTVGLATGLPTLLARVDIWEIPIAGASALILCVVAALWQAWHEGARRARWMAVASLGIGLAVATRPTAILCAPLLMLPLMREWRENRWARGGCLLSAGAFPLGFCLGALALYNEARFGSPVEFGQRYQLAAGEYEGRIRQFSFDYLWDNFRIYFLNFTPWKSTFPFIGEMPKLVFRSGHAQPEFSFGILGNVPLVWLAFTAWLVWKRKDGLAFLAGLIVMIAFAQIGLLMFFFGAVSRYEVELLTPLLLLAAIGLLAAEAAHFRRSIFRVLWIVLAAPSIAFNLCHAADHAIRARRIASFWFVNQRQPQAALEHFEILLQLEPQKADSHNMRGFALAMLARWADARAEFETAIRLEPGNANAHCNLGLVYLEEKDPRAALAPLQESLRLNPHDERTKAALGRALQALQIPSSGSFQ